MKNHKKSINKNNDKNNISKDLEESIDNSNVDNEDNDNYFCIKNYEKIKVDNKKENKNVIIKNQKEPKDRVRSDEPKDNLRKKNKNIAFIGNKELICRFNSTNISSSKQNIFEDEDLNPTNKLVCTNKKDVVNIRTNNNLINININKLNNQIKKIEIKDNNNNNSNGNYNDKQMLNSPSSIKFNNKFIKDSTRNNKNGNKIQLNNIKKIDKKPSTNIQNNTISEKKNKTLKNGIKYLVNIENIHITKKNSNTYHRLSPSPLHTNNEYILNNNERNHLKERKSNILTVKNKDNYNNINQGNINTKIFNKFNWEKIDNLIIKEKIELTEIIRCFIEISIDLINKKDDVFKANQYIYCIIDYYSQYLNNEELILFNNKIISLFLLL